MGMYTQIRGWLCVGSINSHPESGKLFNEAKAKYIAEQSTPRCYLVASDTNFQVGSNHCRFIFIGTELKNYDNDAENWIKYLLSVFPWAEGRIDFQFENDTDKCKCWKIYDGEIDEYYEKRWYKGYGLE
jgi:hypothetical protein